MMAAASFSASRPLRSIFGEHGLRLLAQPHRLVELGLDARLALIDAGDHPAMRAQVDEQAEKDDKGDGDPGFGFEHGCPFNP